MVTFVRISRKSIEYDSGFAIKNIERDQFRLWFMKNFPPCKNEENPTKPMLMVVPNLKPNNLRFRTQQRSYTQLSLFALLHNKQTNKSVDSCDVSCFMSILKSMTTQSAPEIPYPRGEKASLLTSEVLKINKIMDDFALGVEIMKNVVEFSEKVG